MPGPLLIPLRNALTPLNPYPAAPRRGTKNRGWCPRFVAFLAEKYTHAKTTWA